MNDHKASCRALSKIMKVIGAQRFAAAEEKLRARTYLMMKVSIFFAPSRGFVCVLCALLWLYLINRNIRQGFNIDVQDEQDL